MFEFDRSIAEDWFENHTRNGGKIYTADFRDYYEEHYISKVNNIPIDFYNSIENFMKCNFETVHAYSQLSNDKLSNHLRFDKYYFEERASHMIWLIQEPNIIYKPSISYSHAKQKLRLIQGGGRMLSLYYNKDTIPVLYYDYNDMPHVSLTDMTAIDSADKLLTSFRIDSTDYNDKVEEIELLKNLFNNHDDNQYYFLNFACSGKLNFSAQTQWQDKSVEYWHKLQQFSTVVDAIKEITSGPDNIFRN